MAQETQYTANTGVVLIDTANTSLTGSGTLGTVLTAGANGTLVKRIIVKAISTTSQGMVRLFITGGGNTRLLNEIEVPAVTPSGTDTSFEYWWDCNLTLKAGYVLKASTETGDDFNVVAEGLDWTYFTGDVRPESAQYTANTGLDLMTAANTSRTGSGTLYTAVTAGSSATYKGCRVDSVTFKTIEDTAAGVMRLFIYKSSTAYLFSEVRVPATTKSGTAMAFQHTVNLNFELEAGCSIKCSTNNGEDCVIVGEGNDWKYPPTTAIYNFTPASGTNTTSEEILHSLQIPAGLLTTGNMLGVYASILCNVSGNNKTFRMYANTSSALGGATLLATMVTGSDEPSDFSRYFPVISDTALECYAGASTSMNDQYDPGTSGTSANVTVPSVSAGFYLIISGQKATAGDTDTVRWSMAKREF